MQLRLSRMEIRLCMSPLGFSVQRSGLNKVYPVFPCLRALIMEALLLLLMWRVFPQVLIRVFFDPQILFFVSVTSRMVVRLRATISRRALWVLLLKPRLGKDDFDCIGDVPDDRYDI